MRPRDLIAFVNAAIRSSDGDATLGANVIRAAEGEYSVGRLDALCDEWELDYPCLRIITALLKNRSQRFSVCDVSDSEILDLLASESGAHVMRTSGEACPIALSARHFNATGDGDDLRCTLFSIFYQVGLVGLKIDRWAKYQFSYENERQIAKAEIRPTTRVTIQPTFYRVLGTSKNEELDASVA